jgi:LmbE family N-acetylglucosaminyl deacetylase
MNASIRCVVFLVFFGFGLMIDATDPYINYHILPHPDDEISSYSMWHNAQAEPQVHNVFVSMTRGDTTTGCTTWSWFRPELGEVAPSQDTSKPPGISTDECIAQRFFSWHGFLNQTIGDNGYYQYLGIVDLSQTGKIALPPSVQITPAHVWTGGSATRIIFMFPDSGPKASQSLMSLDQVVWALRAIIANKAILQIPTDFADFTAVAPYRNIDPRCYVYDHPDHRVLHHALFTVDVSQGGSTPGFVVGPQGASFWNQRGATCDFDKDVRLVLTVPLTKWQEILQVDPTTKMRLGSAQRYYGWLDWNSSGWPWKCDVPSDRRCLFTRKQYFWSRF